MKYLRSIVSIGGILFASGAFLVPLCVLGLLNRSGRLSWPLTRAWAWTILLTGGVERIRPIGFEQLDRPGPAIVMSNHESFLDPVVMMALSRTPLRFMARHNLFYLPLFGWAMWANGHIPVRRGSPDSAQQSLRKAGKSLADDGKVVIYPEGSRASSTDMLPLKKGGILLAIRTGTPIIPVGIAGTRSVCPRGWHWAGRNRVAAIVGRPIRTTGYTNSTAGELASGVRQRILELRTEAVEISTARTGSSARLNAEKLKNQES